MPASWAWLDKATVEWPRSWNWEWQWTWALSKSRIASGNQYRLYKKVFFVEDGKVVSRRSFRNQLSRQTERNYRFCHKYFLWAKFDCHRHYRFRQRVSTGGVVVTFSSGRGGVPWADHLQMTRKYGLADFHMRAMKPILQFKVTADCERRVADGSAIREIIDAHRPKEDRSVQSIYDRAADRFQARIWQLRASGKDEMCGPKKSDFLLNVAKVAVDSFARIEPGAVDDTNKTWHRRLQRQFDEMVKFWSCGHVLPPRFPASPQATCEKAGVYPGGVTGSTAPAPDGTGAGDTADTETAPQVDSGREHLTPDDLLARASDRSLAARARVGFAARAAQGFRSAVEAHLASGEDHADAVAALEVRKHAALASQARLRVGSASDTVAGVQEHVNVALNAAHANRAVAQELERR